MPVKKPAKKQAPAAKKSASFPPAKIAKNPGQKKK
jgi:hypothetical protein